MGCWTPRECLCVLAVVKTTLYVFSVNKGSVSVLPHVFGGQRITCGSQLSPQSGSWGQNTGHHFVDLWRFCEEFHVAQAGLELLILPHADMLSVILFLC